MVFPFGVARKRHVPYSAPVWTDGGRYKVRTCDPYDVNVVLYH